MDNVQLIASVAAFFTTVSFVPQAIKTIKTRETKSISFWTYFFSIVGVSFWLTFGIMINNIPMILQNLAVLASSSIILWIKASEIFKNDNGKENKTPTTKKLKKLMK